MRDKTKKPRWVHAYTDRNGIDRIYLRKPGERRVALPGPVCSNAFWDAYNAAVSDQPREVLVTRNPAGSISSAIAGYYSSAEYKRLSASSKMNYRRVLEHFRTEHGEKSLASLETRHVNAIMDSMAKTPAAANILRKRLNSVFEYAIGAGLVDDNPIKRAKRVKYDQKSYRSWTEADIAAYRAEWKEGTSQRLALELLLYTGLRRSDVVRVGWKHIKGGAIHISTVKSQHKTHLRIPIHAELQHHLDLVSHEQKTFLTTTWSKDRSAKGFTNWLREAAHDAGLPSDSSPHGLRHAACRRLAEAGCTPHEIQAITGHRNLAQVETYTRAVDQARLAESAIARLANPQKSLATLDDNTLKLLGNLVAMALPSGIEPLSPP
jgi:integrase